MLDRLDANAGQLNALTVYCQTVAATDCQFELCGGPTAFAIPACSSSGNVQIGKFFILQPVSFSEHVLLVCSCDEASCQVERICSMSNPSLPDELAKFIQREEQQYCLHAKAGKHFGLSNPGNLSGLISSNDDEQEQPAQVAVLRTEPILLCVWNGSYGLLQKQRQRLHCMICRSDVVCEKMIRLPMFISFSCFQMLKFNRNFILPLRHGIFWLIS